MDDKRLIDTLTDWLAANASGAMIDNHDTALRDLRQRLTAADFTIVAGLQPYLADLAKEKQTREQESDELLGWEYDVNRAKIVVMDAVIRRLGAMR